MKKESFAKRRILPLVKAKAFTLFCFLIVLVILFTVWAQIVGKNFFAASTIRNIFQSLVVTSFLTIGSGCLLIAGNVDLSLSSIGCFGGIVVAASANNGLPWFVCIILGLLLCAVLGLINGIMVSKFRFPAFIATLGMTSIAKGATYIYSQFSNKGVAANINFKSPVIEFLGKGKLFGLPFGIYVMVVFFIIYGILISKTRFGMRMVLVGGNPVAAQLAGINANKILIILFVNGAVLSGVAGVFNSARLAQGSLTALSTNQFSGLTAAILGGISFGGGVGGMGGAFIGLLILNTFQIGMNVVGVNPFWVTVFSGILLLVALAVDFFQMQAKAAAKKA